MTYPVCCMSPRWSLRLATFSPPNSTLWPTLATTFASRANLCEINLTRACSDSAQSRSLFPETRLHVPSRERQHV